jgi:hypothetical protein
MADINPATGQPWEYNTDNAVGLQPGQTIDPSTGLPTKRQSYLGPSTDSWNAPAAPGSAPFEMPTDIMPYSGLPESYRDQLLSFVMPQLQSGVENMSGNIDEFTNQALGSYQQQLQSSLKTMIPNQINQLANRGILSSSVASDTLSQTMSQAATQSATKGYETAMQAALMKANIPTTLAGLLQYGRSDQDPTVMYQTMAQLLASL